MLKTNNSIPLSLCIATMNREQHIRETLESIVSQLPPEVEIVILDGSSHDATEKIVEQLRPRIPRLQYEHRAPNGFDRDFCAAVEMSRGDYCWLLPDDDILLSGAIDAVLRALAKKPDCVIVNAEVRDHQLRQLLDPSRLHGGPDRVYSPLQFEDFARDVLKSEYVAYVGAIVVRREEWDARSKDPYFETDFLPAAMVLQGPFKGNTMVLATPWIAIRYGVALWQNRAFNIWFICWPNVIWSFDSLSSELKQFVTPREPWRDYKRLTKWRALGWFSWRIYSKHQRQLTPGIPLRIWILLLCATPVPVLNRLVAWYTRWRKPNDDIGQWDLNRGLTER